MFTQKKKGERNFEVRTSEVNRTEVCTWLRVLLFSDLRIFHLHILSSLSLLSSQSHLRFSPFLPSEINQELLLVYSAKFTIFRRLHFFRVADFIWDFSKHASVFKSIKVQKFFWRLTIIQSIKLQSLIWGSEFNWCLNNGWLLEQEKVPTVRCQWLQIRQNGQHWLSTKLPKQSEAPTCPVHPSTPTGEALPATDTATAKAIGYNSSKTCWTTKAKAYCSEARTKRYTGEAFWGY